ncbi:hypothetical protein DMP14_20810 [Pseudonocardia sp. Ae707_Ps2]
MLNRSSLDATTVSPTMRAPVSSGAVQSVWWVVRSPPAMIAVWSVFASTTTVDPRTPITATRSNFGS